MGVETRATKPAGLAGRLGLSLFFVLFAAFGLGFTVALGMGLWREWQSRQWVAAPCRVLESRVTREDGSQGKYRFSVRYEYRWEGRVLESSRWRLNLPSFSGYAQAQAVADRFPTGRDMICRVNPARPTEAILEHGSLAMGLFALVPLVFVLVGVGGLVLTWRRPRGAGGEVPRPLSAPAVPLGWARWVPVLFFGVFFAVGLVLLYWLLWRPLAGVSAARHWPAVPCVVEASQVRRHSGSKGTTYSVDILYRYEFNGRTHRSSRYDFVEGGTGGHAAKEEIVRRHPPGRRTVCYVNPANPAEAVLYRGISRAMWLGLIPLAFVTFGAVGLMYFLRAALGQGGSRGAAGGRAGRRPGEGLLPDLRTRELKSSAPPLARVVVLLLITLFWNGFLSVFVYQVIRGFARGRPEWLAVVFLIPFVLVGLGLIAAVIHGVLALFNPRPRLSLTPGVGVLGGELRVAWSFRGAVERLQRLQITIEGRETAVYRRGTDNITDRSVFARVTVVDLAERAGFRAGHAAVRLPAEGVAPSFATQSNKIEWLLNLRGVIAHWPDVMEEFPIEVRPAPAAGTTTEAPATAAEVEPARSASGRARLGVRGGRRQLRPGEVVEGVAGWSLDRALRTAEVRLLWFTRGKGTQDVAVVNTVRFSAPGREAVQPFRFTLPEGPLSFDGRLIALHWALELVLEPGTETARWEFALTAGGPPPQLPCLPDERVERVKRWFQRFERRR